MALPEEIWRRRLESEFNEMRSAGGKFEVAPDYTEYTISLRGPGLYRDAGGVKKRDQHTVVIALNRNYPYAGGIDVVWLTPIFHPNIRESDGKVCIQLVNDWAENQTVAAVVQALHHMLENPNPGDPLNKEAAEYFVKNGLAAGIVKAKPRIVLSGEPEAPKGPRLIQ